MDIFRGLSPEQQKIIQECRSYREVKEGEIIFREGAKADSMFTIITGAIEIYREHRDQKAVIAELGPPQVFGEMGLLTSAGRSATARAMQNSLLFEVPLNLVEILKEKTGAEGTMKLLENLICILADRIRSVNSRSAALPESKVIGREEVIRKETREALDVFERNMGSGVFSRYAPTRDLRNGEYLCKQGDYPEEFYFIHKGTLEVTDNPAGGEEHTMTTLRGPTVTGELGFFTREKRSVSIRAKGPVEYSRFSGMDYLKLKKNDVDEALNLIFAAARMAVFLLIKSKTVEDAEL